MRILLFRVLRVTLTDAELNRSRKHRGCSKFPRALHPRLLKRTAVVGTFGVAVIRTVHDLPPHSMRIVLADLVPSVTTLEGPSASSNREQTRRAQGPHMTTHRSRVINNATQTTLRRVNSMQASLAHVSCVPSVASPPPRRIPRLNH